MAKIMKFTLYLFICFVICFAVAELREEEQVADLQRDIQDYLRMFTQQQHSSHTRQPPHGSILPFSRLNLPVDGSVGRASEDLDGGPSPLISPGLFPFESVPRGGGARSYASSSVTVKRPRPGTDEDQIMGAEAVAYSSIRDVDNEEHLGDDDVFGRTSLANEKLTAKVTSKAVSDPMARKQDLTTHTETIVKDDGAFSDVYFIAIVAGCSAAGIFGIISAGFCFYRLQKSSKAAAEVDYPAYGVTGPNKDTLSPSGDRKLAQSAQMYHYQHQKQQMIAVEKAGSTKNTSASDVDSEEENEEGDYTVYECPGLAPTGEMEVKNPLFNDDSTPVSPPLPVSKEHSQNK